MSDRKKPTCMTTGVVDNERIAVMQVPNHVHILRKLLLDPESLLTGNARR